MRNIMKHKKRRRSIKALAVLSLAMVMLILPSVAGLASVADQIGPSTLTVMPGNDVDDNDINNAGVVIDLYKVADVQQMKGYDTIEYVPIEAYANLFSVDKGKPSMNDPDINNDEWRELGQIAAKTALGIDGEAQTPIVTGRELGKEIKLEDSGVYLVIAKGTTLSDSDYYTTDPVVTKARSSNNVYTFQPQLVVLPTKPKNQEGDINTANPGEWTNKREIALKAEIENRKASMEIIKSLDSYEETKGPATFVFDVEGTLDGKQVYSNSFSVNFNEPGTKSIPIDNLPAGTVVRVTEVYSGANYTAAVTEADPVTISVDQIAQARFSNTYDNPYKGGGSVTNRFAYDKTSDSNGPKGWTWESGIDHEGNNFANNK